MVVFKDTRGRRSTSQKIRDWVHAFKGASWAGSAAVSLTDAIGTTALFGTLVYTGRPRIVSTLARPDSATITGYVDYFALWNIPRTESVRVVPTMLGRPIKDMAIVHPDVGIGEGLGILALLSALPGGDLTGFVEKGLGIGLYHALLNGFKFTIPGITSTSLESWTAQDWARIFLVGFGGSAILDILSPAITGVPPPPKNNMIEFSGLMGTLVWGIQDIARKLQAEIDSGKLGWPLPLTKLSSQGTTPGNYGFGFDGYVLPVYIQRWLHNLGHAGLVTVLFRRGLGQKLNE